MGCVVENVEQRSQRRGDDLFRVAAGGEEEAAEENEAGEHADGDTVDHDLWPVDGCIGDFFDHVRDRIEAGQSEATYTGQHDAHI